MKVEGPTDLWYAKHPHFAAPYERYTHHHCTILDGLLHVVRIWDMLDVREVILSKVSSLNTGNGSNIQEKFDAKFIFVATGDK